MVYRNDADRPFQASGSDGGNLSRADLALCGMLTFWTNGDLARIDQLFRHSALVWPQRDQRHRAHGAMYGEMTVRKGFGLSWSNMMLPT